MSPRPRYAYLGPAGTFTEAALRQVTSRTRPSSCPSSTSSPRSMRCAAGLRTSRSSRSRTPSRARSPPCSTRSPPGDLVIVREMLVPVSFSLAARAGTALGGRGTGRRAPARLGAVPPLAERAPPRRGARARGVEHRRPRAVADDPAATPDFEAALVPPAALEHYPLSVLAEQVADNPGAVTRFVVVGHPGELPAPTGADKTSLVVHLPDNEAGALLTMLEQFATPRREPVAHRVPSDRRRARPLPVLHRRRGPSRRGADGRGADGAAPGLPGRPLPRLVPEGRRRPQRGAPGTSGDDFEAARAWVDGLGSRPPGGC